MEQKTFKELRKDRGISVSFISRKLGKSTQTIRNKENGITEFTWAEGCQLCKIYNVDFNEVRI